MQLEQLKQVVEVLIFASDIPLPADQIRATVEETTAEDVVRAVDELNAEYRRTDRTFQIVHVAGGYQMVTHENYTSWVRKLFAGRLKQKLSQAAMETLSVIAFRQPVGKPDIEAIRGVNCDGVIRTLLERKLITLSGRDDGPGRALLYKTTREFLRYFGVNDISDLPKPKELEELFKESGVQQNLLADLPEPGDGPAAGNPAESGETGGGDARRAEAEPGSGSASAETPDAAGASEAEPSADASMDALTDAPSDGPADERPGASASGDPEAVPLSRPETDAAQ
ncbi:MAG: SMC-Scp complex subunit ScpB [bacterium]|nr:SMC-Scp complex subunit ScpB [bacterium]